MRMEQRKLVNLFEFNSSSKKGILDSFLMSQIKIKMMMKLASPSMETGIPHAGGNKE